MGWVLVGYTTLFWIVVQELADQMQKYRKGKLVDTKLKGKHMIVKRLNQRKRWNWNIFHLIVNKSLQLRLLNDKQKHHRYDAFNNIVYRIPKFYLQLL